MARLNIDDRLTGIQRANGHKDKGKLHVANITLWQLPMSRKMIGKIKATAIVPHGAPIHISQKVVRSGKRWFYVTAEIERPVPGADDLMHYVEVAGWVMEVFVETEGQKFAEQYRF